MNCPHCGEEVYQTGVNYRDQKEHYIHFDGVAKKYECIKKAPILDLEQRTALKDAARGILKRAPEGHWMFVEGCLSLIAELEIKEAVIEQLGHHKLERETRCTSMQPLSSGMYRCVLELRDGHTEHQYNYFRSLTKQEKAQWFPEDAG